MRLNLPSRLALIACLAYTPLAFASLGAGVDSIDADQAKMSADRHSSVLIGYQMHELKLATGTVVREFTDSHGLVFAVSWHGPFKPDLNQLLGASFARYAAQTNMPRASHTAVAVHESDLVIESTGRMRAFAGRAYLPQAVPAGVSISTLQ